MTDYWLGIDKQVYLIGGLKILHIGYLTIIYLIFGYLYTNLFESIYGNFDIDVENRKPIIIQILELISMLWFAAVFLFMVDRSAHKIPHPKIFKGYKYSYSEHFKAIREAGIFIFLFLFFQNSIFDKVSNNFINITKHFNALSL
jgi:hypothetical protein